MAVLTLSVLVAVGLTALFDPGQIKPITQALGFGRPHRLLPVVNPAVKSSVYSILHTDHAGDPITYDPCKPLRYVINPTGAPPDYQSFIQPAIAKTQAATGLKFAYGGLSTDSWATRQHSTRNAPVLITFVDSLGSSASHPHAVGLGGSSWMTITGLWHPQYVTGGVELLRGWFIQRSAHHDTGAEESVVMHELGHVIGLNHVRDRNEIMYPVTSGQTEYGAGDRSGLARLGAGQCAE